MKTFCSLSSGHVRVWINRASMHYPTKIDMDTLVSIREKKKYAKTRLWSLNPLPLFTSTSNSCHKKNQGGACEGWEKRTIHAASIL